VTWQTNIPQATDLISGSQNDLLQNFQAVDAAWNINHDDFNSATQGKHKFVEMPNQAGIPAGAANQMTFYSDATSGQSELYLKRDNAGTPVQMSGPAISNATNGWSFLPGGLLIQWGVVLPIAPATSVADPVTLTYPTAFSAPAYSVTVTGVRDGTSARGIYIKDRTAPNFTATSCIVRVEGAGINALFFMAIGPA
jgi:hypothetical protein